jgi:hypothetical protein
VQLVLHAQQASGLLLGELEHRDAGPVAEHLGDQLVVDLGDDVEVAGATASRARPLGEQLLLVAQRRPSRSPARRSPTPSPAASAIFSSNSRRSGGAVIRRMRRRAPASSIRSIALSGRKRSLM